eukprot:3498249-Rhodomonas_salina.1
MPVSVSLTGIRVSPSLQHAFPDSGTANKIKIVCVTRAGRHHAQAAHGVGPGQVLRSHPNPRHLVYRGPGAIASPPLVCSHRPC